MRNRIRKIDRKSQDLWGFKFIRQNKKMVSLNATLFPTGSAKARSVINSDRSDALDYTKLIFGNVTIYVWPS